MNYQRALFIVLMSLSTTVSSIAQIDLPIFSWRTHFSYNHIVDLTQSSTRLYAAAQNAIFYVDLEDFSVNKITKIDGLSDVTIGAIGHNEQTQLLVVGYTNGNIDLVSDSQIININDLKNAEIIGNKNFSEIEFYNGLIYMANDQGVFVIDPIKAEISESYRNLSENGQTLQINDIEIFNDQLYAATPNGIIWVSLTEDLNRQDFNNWERDWTQVGFQKLVSTEDNILASAEGFFYEIQNGNWERASIEATFGYVQDLHFSGSTTYVLTTQNLFQLDEQRLIPVEQIDGLNDITSILSNPAGLWLGTERDGLQRFSQANGQSFSPIGPVSDIIWQLSSRNSTVTNLTGGYDFNRDPFGRAGLFSQFDNGSWDVLNSIPEGINDLIDFANVSDSRTLLASFTDGLVDLENGSIIDNSSPSTTLQVKDGNHRITSIEPEGNVLWISTHDFENSIHKWDIANDSWESFTFGLMAAEYPLDILVLPNGDKWVTLDASRGGGILVFNNESGLSRYLTTSGGQGGLPGREVTSMVLDDNGFLWVGTGAGIAFYSSPSTVLQGGSLTASVPIFENGFLFRNEFITAITIDSGNRKWIGTLNNGVWLFNETGQELVHHFTTLNSPLPSNEINEIAVDSKGEVFIGTSAGLVSFQSDAIGSENSHTDVKVFPNPVTRDYSGPVTISGLVRAAKVKITDVSGKLVREIEANGSSAIWDTRDYNGNRVKTGVYLVFSSDSDGIETHVSKIAVI